MENMDFDYNCVKCLLGKNLKIEDTSISNDKKTLYFKRVLKIIANSPEKTTAPEIVEKITDLQNEMGISSFDYASVKSYYNNLLMNFEGEIYDKIINSDDPLFTAVCYALIGNYIDFATSQNITEEKLQSLIDNIQNVTFKKDEFENFKNEIKTAKRLVYVTDNCGEIVFDKLFIKYLKQEYKALNIDVIVRGREVLNDATMQDAVQIGLDSLVNVQSNGTGVAGTVLNKINDKSKQLIDAADIIIAKGMGNFETLMKCSKNVYYIFMCKCDKFCSVFNVPLNTYMFLSEKRFDFK